MISSISRVGMHPTVVGKVEEERLIKKYVAVKRKVPPGKCKQSVKNLLMKMEELLDYVPFHRQMGEKPK